MNHPDDERLVALADPDADASADAATRTHVAECTRCSTVVDELGMLRATLAELPDVAPSRPLRLIPAADPEPGAGERLGGWIRRFFTPLVTAGAALALVGAVGTAGPAFQGTQAAPGAADGAGEPASLQRESADAAAEEPSIMGDEDAGYEDEDRATETDEMRLYADEPAEMNDGDDATTTLPAERSPWPMVLFSGIALIIGVLLLRWILAARAG